MSRRRHWPGSCCLMRRCSRIMAVLAMSAALPWGTVFTALRSSAAAIFRVWWLMFLRQRSRPPMVQTLWVGLFWQSCTSCSIHVACTGSLAEAHRHHTLMPGLAVTG